MHPDNNNASGQVPGYVPPQQQNPPVPENPMHVDVNAPVATPIPDPRQQAAAGVPVAGSESLPLQAQHVPPQAYAPGTASAVQFEPQPAVQQVSPPPAPPVEPPSGGAQGESAAPAPDGQKKGNGTTIALIIVAVLLVISLGGWLIASVAGALVPAMDKLDAGAYEEGEKVAEVIDAPNQDLDKNLANVVAETAMPSVATIYTYATPEKSPSYEEMFDMLFGRGNGTHGGAGDVIEEDVEAEPVMTGLGSGIVIREDGYIVTNNHVVSGADKLMVNIGDESFEGELVGTDPSSDIAVVKIEPGDAKLHKIEVADSDKLRIGDWVMALGAPLGYEQSATTGIVSALGRDSVMDDGQGGITIYADMIQTDAAINSGNSGGALVDDEARLVGINTLVAASGTGAGQADNLGFAIPSNYAIAIANQIIDNGGASHAKLGVSLSASEDADGAVVANVVADSAAAAAGIQEGDVIVAVNGEKTETPEEVIYDIRASQPGEKVTVSIERDGQTQDIEVALGSDGAAQQKAKQENKGDYKGGFLGLGQWAK